MSSRRKQVNPNRVHGGQREPEFGSNNPVGPDSAIDSYPIGRPEENDNPDDDMPSPGSDSHLLPPPPLINGYANDYDAPLDMSSPMPVIGCPRCPQKFSSSRDLEMHYEDTHGPESKRPRLEAPSEDYPTAYHRLGRELFESTAEVPLTNGHMESDRSPGRALTESPRMTPPVQNQMVPRPVEQRRHEDFYSERGQPCQPKPPMQKIGGKEIQGEQTGNKERIFHMDAYCELCDREFCNKYFLKTHKANKHGIYEDTPPPPSSVPLPFPGLMMPQDPLASFNYKMDPMKPPTSSEPIMPWSFKLEQSSQPPKKPDGSPGLKHSDSALPMFPMPLPPMEIPKTNSSIKTERSSSGTPSNEPLRSMSLNTSTVTSSATSMLSNITNSIKSSASNAPPANDPSMEDYCHICQKHFCNKYYLKKHKQDVHGIAPENPPNPTNKRRSSNLMDHPMTSSNPMILPQPLVSLAGMHNFSGIHGMPNLQNIQNIQNIQNMQNMQNLPNMPGMPNMPPGLMVINPYSMPPVAIIPAGSLMPGQQMPPQHQPMISQPMNISPLPTSSILPPAPPTPTSMPSSNGPSDKNSISKSSPSPKDTAANCEICNKEFCDEFYLQMHKESKHGIKRGSDDGNKDRALSLVKEKERDTNRHEANRPSPPPLASVVKHEFSLKRPRSPQRGQTPEGAIMVCNLCNKDFTNKYLYRIHRIHDHGLNEMIDPTLVENGELPSKEDAMRNMNESLMRMAADANAVGYASSFGIPPGSKSQESAVCDICNKEMTNQYFLRVHKFNIHGIDPSTNEKYDRRGPMSPLPPNSKPKTPPSSGSNIPISSPSQPLNLTPHTPGKPPMMPFLHPKMNFKDMSPFADFGRDFKSLRDMPSFLNDSINNELFARSQNQMRHMDLNFFGLPALGKLPGEENVKLNFDPEAYCEICKKEFCSKYFLRTHKQNIHGIKVETTPTTSSISKSIESEKNTMSLSMSPLKPNVISSNMNFSNMNNSPMINSPMINSNGKPKDNYEKSSWRWKEPVNSSRVNCDICNKELCNKYFLRTHKIKKHGIPASALSPNVSMNGSPLGSDCDTASNASSLTDEKTPIKPDPFNLPQMIPLPPTDRLNEKYALSKAGYVKGKDDALFNNNTEQSEACNICNRRFKNLKWLKDHIVKEHSGAEALDMRSSKNTANPIYPCQVCGLDFPAELSYQLHLIQEHNARVTLNTEVPQIPTEEPALPNGEGKSPKFGERGMPWSLRKKFSSHGRTKKYVCTRCDFDTNWLSTLMDHERSNHGIVCDSVSGYSCHRCGQSSPSPNGVSAHLVTTHGLTIEEAVSEIQNVGMTSSNSFKCSHCPAVFPSQAWAMAHVRHVHVRARRDFQVRNSYQKNVLRCPSCPFKTHFSNRLQKHVKSSHRRSSFQSSSAPINYQTTSKPFPPSSPLSSQAPETLVVPSGFVSEDPSLATTNAMYKSIAASLLSAPEGNRPESPPKSRDREELLLQSYNLPLNAGAVVDANPFKLAPQSCAHSAVVGL